MLIRLLEGIGALWSYGLVVLRFCGSGANIKQCSISRFAVACGSKIIGEISQFRSSGAYFWVFSAVLVSSLSGYIFSFILWPHFVASFCGLILWPMTPTTAVVSAAADVWLLQQR